MKCPSCKTDTLQPCFIESSFRAHTCSACQGNWILIEDFVTWSERNNADLANTTDTPYELEDSKSALLCPLTGSIMLKYRISADTDHKLDYSPRVGGVWLDKGEWEYLKEQGIASKVNSVFSDHWQKQIRVNDTKATFEALYEKKFGEEDYQKVKELRGWLEASPNKAELRAYLLANDPYGG